MLDISTWGILWAEASLWPSSKIKVNIGYIATSRPVRATYQKSLRKTITPKGGGGICSSVVNCLPSKHKVLALIPSQFLIQKNMM